VGQALSMVEGKGVTMKARTLASFKSVLDFLEKWEMVLCIILFALVLCMYTLEVFTRYLFNYSSVIMGEVALYMMTWVYFIGFAIIFKRGENIVLEYFFKRFRKSLQNFLAWMTHLLILLFSTVVFIGSLRLFSVTSKMFHPVLPVKQCYSTLPIVVGSFFVLMISLYFALDGTLQFLKRNAE
jgi:TRAP-type C4-dicarboxylate transport system permease small subunit